ncbi:biotin transporter BioY [candidate division KSB1 bacterium]|nr:biotin transporter BioY [candidate division KSB1 bacterium]
MNPGVKQLMLAGFFTALTAVSALFHIPLPLVPLSLQTLVLVCSANVLSPGLSVLSQFVYLFLGLVGLPIFAGGGGLTVVFSPSFGYLLAFPLAAGVISTLQHRFTSLTFHFRWGINFFGLFIILSIGTLWLWAVAPLWLEKTLSPRLVLFTGMIIFLPGELLKSFFATLLMQKLSVIK